MNELLKYLNQALEGQKHNITRISASTDGETVESLEFVPDILCRNIYSVAKTYTMTAVGFAYDMGLVSPDDKVCEILRGETLAQIKDKRWELATVHHALTHSLGLPGGFLDIDVNPAGAFGKDFLGYMLSYPLDFTPGEKDVYTDGAFYLLSRIAEKTTGMKIDRLLWDKLFYMTGTREAAFSRCPLGHPVGATGIYVHTDDMVKLGLLYVNSGVYCGRRYLSEEWVKMALEREYALNRDSSGLLWGKGGMYGQKLLIIPSLGVSVAVQGFNTQADVEGLVKNFYASELKTV